MVVYNTQNYWGFGLFPSSIILETRKHVLETGSASILRWGGKTPTQLGPLEGANLDHWMMEKVQKPRFWSKHLSDDFPMQNVLKQGDALLPLLFNFALEYTVRRSRKTRWDWN
jgi:hypothetical protein